MNRLALIPVVSCGIGALASEPDFLVAIRDTGDVVRINLSTGAGVQLGGSGIRCAGAIGSRGTQFMGSSFDYLYTVGAAEPFQGHRLVVNRWNGSIWQSTPITGVPAGHHLAGLASDSNGYFCIFQPKDPFAPDLLAKLDYNGSSWSIVGSTGRSDLTCIAASNGTMYALGASSGGALYSINPTTGAATLIGGGSFGGDVQALTGTPQGQLFCCGANLRSINPMTGQTTLIGPIGSSGISALAFVRGNICRIECDGNHHGITGNDFQCFLDRFAAGDPWANCDESTATPLLTANDFQCILNEYAIALAGQCSF